MFISVKATSPALKKIVKSDRQIFVCNALLTETFGVWLHHNEETQTL